MSLRINTIFFLSIFCQEVARTQTPLDKTLETFSFTIGTLGLGISENDFFQIKTKLPKPEPTPSSFREDVVETIEKNGIKGVTYYFGTTGTNPLYELIVEFSDDTTRAAVADKLFGAPNYPNKPDHWIAGAEENVVTLAWAFSTKLVIAANLPNSEWAGDPLFTLPAGFELYKHLPQMSEWPHSEMTRFLTSLEKQTASALLNFKDIKGREKAAGTGSYDCKVALAGAEDARIFINDSGKWTASNTFVSGANAENAILWHLDAANVLNKAGSAKLKLSRTTSKQDKGGMIDRWDVLDAANKPTGIQVGLQNYESGAAGLWNIDILVMRP